MNSSGYKQDFQARINRMNAWKDEQKRTDDEFIKKQNIRLFMSVLIALNHFLTLIFFSTLSVMIVIRFDQLYATVC